MRDDFNRLTLEMLARRVGVRCSNPKCRKPTSGPSIVPTNTVNIGVGAHITAASPGGPRFNRNKSARWRRSIANGIWLCQNCAKLIDNDITLYAGKRICLRWKSVSENLAREALESTAARTDSGLTNELITIIEIRAGAILDELASLTRHAVQVYRSERRRKPRVAGRSKETGSDAANDAAKPPPFNAAIS